jgi:hypothetical protein
MALDIPNPPNPAAQISNPDGYMTREWYDNYDKVIKALQQRIPVKGTATFAAATTVVVTFTNAEASTAYDVSIDGGENKTFWVTSKATTGFTINASGSTSATVGWTLTRR